MDQKAEPEPMDQKAEPEPMDQKAEPEPMDQEAEPEPMDQAPTTDGTMQPSTSQPFLTAMDEVFANNMLRKMILEHVIYPDSTHSNKVNYADLPNVRLVEKKWLSTASRMLLERRDPLYNFSLGVRLLPSFVEMITHPERSDQFTPPFSATLVCGLFTPENHTTLREFLVNCAPGLTSLHLMIPKNCSMTFIFPQISLSILQHLTVEFVLHSHPTNAAPDVPVRTGVPYFIQQLLNSTVELKTLEFRTTSDSADSSVVPIQLELIWIPRTITALRMKCPFLANHLNMMVPSKNTIDYAHLTELEIMASEAPMTVTTIYEILARHCTTLKRLKLSGKHEFADIIQPTMFRVPPMKHLEEFTVSSPIWSCTDDFHMQSSNFPELATFQMNRITVSLFEKLTNPARARLRFVENVKVSLVNELLPEEYFISSVTLDKDKIQRIHWAFRNVTKLDISIIGKEASGLKYIFSDMVKLTSLAINVNHGLPKLDQADFEGLMIGVPPGLTKGLLETPSFWERIKLKENINYPPITRLTALVELTLATVNSPIFYDFNLGMTGRLVSELTFKFAFFRMPELKNLHLYGLFDPSDVMINLWREQKESVGAAPIVHGLERYPPRE